jgi:hypothetical protein
MNPESLQLPSGRVVALAVEPGLEKLIVTAPEGGLELTIMFGPNGATVRLGAGRVELAAQQLSVQCESLDLTAQGTVQIQAEEFRVRTERSIHLNGETVRLNCPPGIPAIAPPNDPEAS